MLPDFAISVALEGLGGRVLVARDVPACVFFYDFPRSVPFTECWIAESDEGRSRINARLEEWVDGLLTRVVVTPRLTLELVRRLGAARNQVALGYLRTIGWIEADEEAVPATAELLASARGEPDPGRGAPPALRIWTAPPEPALKGALRLLAAKGRALPSVLWGLPISEWIFNWRVLLQEDLLAREAERQDEWLN